MIRTRVLISAFLSLAVVTGAVVLAFGLYFLMPSAERVPVEEVAVLVNVMEASPSDAPAQVETRGSVTADQQIIVSPEVAGRVVSVSDELVPGGRFSKGEVMFRVDSRTYAAQVTQRLAQVAQAELEVQLEQGRQQIAEREWELVGDGTQGANTDIALRKPQMTSILAQRESALAALDQAELDLERTAVRAPFNAVVVNESVDVGQVVNSASQAAMLVGTDRARVQVQVPVEQLAHIEIPGLRGAEAGSKAWVRQALGNGEGVERPAEVHRLVGQLDQQTRSATLVLMVDSPQSGEGLPLLPGAYVSVQIEGTPVQDAVRLNRSSVYDGNVVWLVNPEGRLERRTVEIGFRGADDVYVVGGLERGERVVTSALSMPLSGTRVRLSEDVDAKAAADSQPEE